MAKTIETTSMEPPENTMLKIKKRKKQYGTRSKHGTERRAGKPGTG